MLKGIEVTEDLLLGEDGEPSKVLKQKIKYMLPDKKGYIAELSKILGLTNGNADYVKEVLKEVFVGLSVQIGQVNVGTDAIDAAMKLLVDGAAGANRGLPGGDGG